MKFQHLEKFVHNDLPKINNLDPYKALQEFNCFTKKIKVSDFNHKPYLYQIQQLLGFIGSSQEKHSQFLGNNIGDGTSEVIKNICTKIGKQIGIPPRDTLDTYCTHNYNLITFLGNDEERLFIDIVRNSVDLFGKCAVLSELAKNKKDYCALEEILIQINLIKTQYQRYLESDKDGTPKISCDFFRNTLRQYNCQWEIDKKIWGGPTAANTAEVMMLDLILGIDTPEYREHITKRLQYLSLENQNKIQNLFSQRSIKNNILTYDEHFQVVFFKVLKDLANLSKFHFGLINKFLITPNKTDSNNSHRIISSENGTGGMNFDEVRGIRDMRIANSIQK